MIDSYTEFVTVSCKWLISLTRTLHAYAPAPVSKSIISVKNEFCTISPSALGRNPNIRFERAVSPKVLERVCATTTILC